MQHDPADRPGERWNVLGEPLPDPLHGSKIRGVRGDRLFEVVELRLARRGEVGGQCRADFAQQREKSLQIGLADRIGGAGIPGGGDVVVAEHHLPGEIASDVDGDPALSWFGHRVWPFLARWGNQPVRWIEWAVMAPPLTV